MAQKKKSIIIDVYESVSKHKRLRFFLIRLFIILAVFTISLFFFKQLWVVFVTLFLVVIASLSKLYKRFIGFSVGFELVTFASIIFFFSYGFGIGMLLSTLMLISSTLISGRFSQLFVAQWLIYLIVGLSSVALRSLGVLNAGKILVLLYNILLHSLSQFFFHYPIHSTITNFAVNLSSNFLLLDYFSGWFMDALSG